MDEKRLHEAEIFARCTDDQKIAWFLEEFVKEIRLLNAEVQRLNTKDG